MPAHGHPGRLEQGLDFDSLERGVCDSASVIETLRLDLQQSLLLVLLLQLVSLKEARCGNTLSMTSYKERACAKC